MSAQTTPSSNTPGSSPADLEPLHGPALPPKLSERLEAVVESFQDRAVSFRELYQAAEGGAFSFLLILLNLPYIVPIPIPGLSVATGMVTAFIGIRMALRKKPWLPERLLNATLPARFFPTLLKGAVKVLRAVEHLLKPRLQYVNDRVFFHHLNGTIIALCGIFLMLPIPFFIPLTNFAPAIPILLIAAGTMERDGVFVIGGYVSFLVCVAYFTLISGSIWVLVQKIVHQFWT